MMSFLEGQEMTKMYINNIENTGSGSRITPMVDSGSRNGDIRIYRPKKNGILAYVTTISANHIQELDYMGEKVSFDPAKIKTNLHRGKFPEPYKCKDCGVDGMRAYRRMVRCKECQRKHKNIVCKMSERRKAREKLLNERITTTKKNT